VGFGLGKSLGLEEVGIHIPFSNNLVPTNSMIFHYHINN